MSFLQKECQAVKSNYYLPFNKVTALFLGKTEFEKVKRFFEEAAQFNSA